MTQGSLRSSSLARADLAVSLGPNCRSAWNLRNALAFDRAYPFDWWITPARAMLAMIAADFDFRLQRHELRVTGEGANSSVYNLRYNVLHHHDFPRSPSGDVLPFGDGDIAKVEQKYKALFARFHQDLSNATQPVAVLNGSFAGWPREHFGIEIDDTLNRPISEEELALAIRERLGSKVTVVFIQVGADRIIEAPWGYSFTFPDTQYRESPPCPGFAEPVHVFRRAYDALFPDRLGR